VIVLSYAPYLLHINTSSAFENLAARQSLSHTHSIRGAIPAPQHGFLSPAQVSTIPHICHWHNIHSPLASSTCPDLSVPSGSVKVTISLYRGNLTCVRSSSVTLPLTYQKITLTLSKITKGPLTPPIVLYRILGVTLNDDDSRGSPMMIAGLAVEGRQKKEELSSEKASVVVKLKMGGE
jgi:hypothetical protein